MAEVTASPPRSLPGSPTSFSAHRSSHSSSPRPSLSIDLSSLPALSQPSPPSNTLLITDLRDLYLFQPSSLDSIRSQITQVAPLNSFSPLPSMRRIVCSFLSTDDAIKIRQLLDGEALLGRHVRARIYFGEPTPILSAEEARRKKLLEAPQSQKLFFISPPPSPPHGWTMRYEDPPNKEVHATDLAEALAKLKTAQEPKETIEPEPETPVSLASDKRTNSWPASFSGTRSRSSTIIYDPEAHGSNPQLPAVMVEDTTDLEDVEMDMGPIDAPKKIMAHTARPPVELME
ncbi:hypothetical protein DTO027B5_4058 [Paecilomyces variotii]|nr:hypothetical protein DTO032I3_4282 [Paecilomyces variotii]KAJ9242107.1 hypothetical protein DTO169E5_3328 [Paecilomyces variotii]KAJ9260062.1 hypothetical protein DTO207G8_759 [Paecilomyces variotii]KAJ9269598.1 hypothetical protein DTO212C5_4209 [Paecilomyces variotii]KAJ9277029.1 hypothetical protein DTO021D3_6127 [Paecilomyces variotii]